MKRNYLIFVFFQVNKLKITINILGFFQIKLIYRVILYNNFYCPDFSPILNPGYGPKYQDRYLQII